MRGEKAHAARGPRGTLRSTEAHTSTDRIRFTTHHAIPETGRALHCIALLVSGSICAIRTHRTAAAIVFASSRAEPPPSITF
mmetsp:Transcript_49570/g.114510  ORF Transcript_49570/g.114510 Transcript_49570/m.114510 type:complete len:82 (-) Transcript_49570:424-669(-)